jgi:VWFA-related protein
MITRKSILFGFLFILGVACHIASSAGEDNLRAQGNKRVTLNVVAFDDKGHVVGDLTSKDFQMMDQGKTQPIRFFRHDEQQAPVVILFDLLSQGLGAQGYGAQEIIRALEHQDSSDSLYFYLLTREANLQPVRALPDESVQADARGGPWTANIRPTLEAAMNSVVAVRQQYIDNVRTTNRAIETIGQKMAAIPGRKYMIWVSPGVWPAQNTSQVARTLDNEGITLNSVDPAGAETVGSLALQEHADVTGWQGLLQRHRKRAFGDRRGLTFALRHSI